jgi:hypothetical protein
MIEYYWTNFFGASWQELWRISPNFFVFIEVAVLKLFGFRSIPTCGFAVDGVVFIEPNTVPNDVKLRLQTTIDICVSRGFRHCLWSTRKTIGPIQYYCMIMLNNTGKTYAAASWGLIDDREASPADLTFYANSKLSNDTLISTSSDRKLFDCTEGIQSVFLPGSSVDDVLNQHEQRLARIPLECVVSLNLETLKETAQHAVTRNWGFQIKRGLLVKLTEVQVAAINARNKNLKENVTPS